MNKLSPEATKLLEYIYEHRYTDCKGPFGISLLSSRKALGKKSVGELTPFVNELLEGGVLKEAKGIFKAAKYQLKESTAEKYIQDKADAQAVQEYRDALEEEIKNYKRFIVTTAVMGKDAYTPFAESLRNYAARNNALKLVLPCEDVVSRGKKAAPIELSAELKDFRVIFKDTYLNRNLCLSAIKVSAKQINPLSGLDRLPENREASLIIASPKFFLNYVPNMHYEVPFAIMTTGAVTVSNYDNDRYMSKRTSTLAENDHTYGAVIVEIEDDKIFHFRHVQASRTGSFTDLGVEYLPDGTIKDKFETVLVMGDTHVGYHDLELHEKVMEVAALTNVSQVVLHDIFHGSSISHHEAKKSITRAIRASEDKLSLELECTAVKNYIEDIEERGYKIIIPQANHHNHLLRYLEEHRYAEDPINLKFASKLIAPAIEKINPLKYAIESILGFCTGNVEWLDTDVSRRLYGVEIALHGDRGANGGKGNKGTFEKGIGNCVVAHTHSAGIHRKVFTVGTVGQMDMGYNEGLSSWTRTCCLIYDDGTKQLINFIENKDGDYTYTI